jgi:hypothetical protein
MFLADHQCRAAACDRRADRVRADLLFPVSVAGASWTRSSRPAVSWSATRRARTRAR